MRDTNKVAIPIIINKNGEYLLITRSEYPEHKGEWGPIAGHAHPGETIQDALVRESREELNLNVKPVKEVAVIPQDIPGDIGYWWICERISGKIKTNHEIESWGYFSPLKIKRMKLWPATKKFFEQNVFNKTSDSD